MSKEEKAQIVDKVQKVLAESDIGILTDYRGLPNSEIDAVRRKLRESGAVYMVVKNSLAQLAAKRIGRSELIDLFKGPIAVALGSGDITAPAKTLAAYARSAKTELKIKGGFLRNRVLTPQNIDTLSTLPSREILISQVLAGMQGPVVSLISLLAAPMRGLMGVLQARIRQLEGE